MVVFGGHGDPGDEPAEVSLVFLSFCLSLPITYCIIRRSMIYSLPVTCYEWHATLCNNASMNIHSCVCLWVDAVLVWKEGHNLR